ncbi:tetratricopeptide repeat protein [Pseudobacteroides cellulosolvens]|uniref:Tetratricopeptide TPR_1 repeat-containing protein n=1 Tax=Pseudobacteroides cellulosolvens ATCC 35603 = DSM 2933 TaxID=398512 RepID=A0A0L6JTU6_9FIRM|nr:hypothetical protein [Pseudobacteroides cellulosolvens]KNY29261.1 Tetratricopeptide TPR_1 repeat-containing protein [Pseudobacteroides cellulosolvens ATCC 35603 = DSM 2933]
MKKNTNGKKSKGKKTDSKRPPMMAAFIAGMIFVIIVAVVIVAGILNLHGNAADKEVVDEKMTKMEKFIDERKWQEAKNIGNEILSMKIDKETEVDVYWEMGISECYQRNFGAAIDYANKILTINTPSGHFLLGLIYTDMKKYEQAINEFKYAGATGSRYREDADKRIQELEKLVGDRK